MKTIKCFGPIRHYATKTIDFLRANNVKYVDKYRNLTNVPQCRPIEDLFGYLSGKVYSNGWSANNLTKLENRIKYCLKNIDMNVVQRSIDSVKKRLRKCVE